MVGRDAELAQLHKWLEKALSGERQIVFVTGEPGIGKTTVVETLLEQVATDESVWVGRGQCIEHFGAGEAYLPVLEALGRLCREPGREHLIEVLHQHAPTWLVQMPALLDATELEALQRKVLGTTRERMLREMAEALEVLTVERGLVLWFEDLHWSDYSTLDLLSSLARRLEKARLLVLGTYRPVDGREHPLKAVKQELQLHGLCEELPLELLPEAAVAEYLVMRFPGEATGRSPLQHLARMIHQRTEGNPLFMVNVVDELILRAVLIQREGQWELTREITEGDVPAGLRHFIAQQMERVSPEEQQVLEVGSTAGMEFSAAAVAAGLEEPVETVEQRCEGLAQREQFLGVRGVEEWPDGTVTARYGFLHALYQEVMYERVTARRRIILHRKIGEREEAAYGVRAGEIAAALAVHFERGREYRRAVKYLEQAGKNALRRSAHQEAIALLTKGLELLKLLPDTPERTHQELTLQLALRDALVTVKGYTAPEVEKTVTRARELFQQIGETPQLFPVLSSLFLFYFMRGELQTAFELAKQLMRLAQSAQDRYLLSVAHSALGGTLELLGELPSARSHLEQAIALYDPQIHPRPTVNTADIRVDCLSYAAIALWSLGYPDQALKRSHEAVALAEGLSHPFSLAYALGCAALFHSLRREGQVAREQAEAVITLSTEQGFPYWLACGTIERGWVLAEQGQVEEGIAQMQQGLAALRALGTETARLVHLPRLAAAYARVGRIEEGLSVVAEALALVDKIGMRMSEAGLYMLKGWLLLARSGENQAEAESCFRQAVDIARRQSAKSLELRAVMSLSRLWQKQGKTKQAHQMLSEIYGWFTEGFYTKDLQEAKTLLAELAA